MKTVSELVHTDYLHAEAHAALSKLIGMLVHKQQTEACIFSDDTYAGMFSADALLGRARINTPAMKVESVTRAAPRLHTTDSILTAAKRMFESNHAALPVFDGDLFIGVVQLFDVLEELRNLPEVARLTVKDLKQKQLTTIKESDPIGLAITLFDEDRVNRLPVVAADGGYVGFLSLLDMLEHFYNQDIDREAGKQNGFMTRGYEGEKPDMLNLPVRNFMNQTPAVTVELSATLPDIIDTMREAQVLSVLVLSGNQPQRLITERDVLSALISSQVRAVDRIQYRGLHETHIDEFSQYWIDKVGSYYVDKFGLQADDEVVVHIKEFSKTGNTHRYEVYTRINSGKSTIAAHALDWDLYRALHDAFQGLEAELGHLNADRERVSAKKLAAQTGDPNLPGDVPS